MQTAQKCNKSCFAVRQQLLYAQRSSVADKKTGSDLFARRGALPTDEWTVSPRFQQSNARARAGIQHERLLRQAIYSRTPFNRLHRPLGGAAAVNT